MKKKFWAQAVARHKEMCMGLQVKAFLTITVYEALMHWRRRGVAFLMLLAIIGLVGFSIFTEDQLSRPRVSQQFISDGETYQVIETPLPPIEDMEDFASLFPGDVPSWIHTVSYEQFANDQIIVALLVAGLMPLFIGIPPLFAETIPLDRHHRLRELLETVPLTKTTYLAGKVAGLWVSLIAGLLLCAILYGIVARVLFGPYDLLFYAAIWGVVIIPATLVIAAYTVLLASGVGSRRIAALIGALLVPVGLIFASAVMTAIAISGIGLAGATPLATAATYGEVVGNLLANALRMIGVFALALPILWLLAWSWTKWHDRRVLSFPMQVVAHTP
jgi:hypothetical protein